MSSGTGSGGLLSPKEVAQRWKCKVESVLRFIATKELRAMSIAPKGAKRPTWRITVEALESFERNRSTVPGPVPVSRRKRLPGVKNYFS